MPCGLYAEAALRINCSCCLDTRLLATRGSIGTTMSFFMLLMRTDARSGSMPLTALLRRCKAAFSSAFRRAGCISNVLVPLSAFLSRTMTSNALRTTGLGAFLVALIAFPDSRGTAGCLVMRLSVEVRGTLVCLRRCDGKELPRDCFSFTGVAPQGALV